MLANSRRRKHLAINLPFHNETATDFITFVVKILYRIHHI